MKKDNFITELENDDIDLCLKASEIQKEFDKIYPDIYFSNSREEIIIWLYEQKHYEQILDQIDLIANALQSVIDGNPEWCGKFKVGLREFNSFAPSQNSESTFNMIIYFWTTSHFSFEKDENLRIALRYAMQNITYRYWDRINVSFEYNNE